MGEWIAVRMSWWMPVSFPDLSVYEHIEPVELKTV